MALYPGATNLLAKYNGFEYQQYIHTISNPKNMQSLNKNGNKNYNSSSI